MRPLVIKGRVGALNPWLLFDPVVGRIINPEKSIFMSKSKDRQANVWQISTSKNF